MTSNNRKITQREIAKIAGVSQATVSTVLNEREYPNVRIPAATRERVLRAIEQTTYVVDPSARRLQGLDNKILGVFTYEPALSRESMDFYGPLLNGIERAAERISCDLMFFTASPLVDGVRSLFHKNTRFRLADGCLLLGQQMNSEELARLVAEDFPFVAIGRRDEPDVPYVGIDYRSLTASLLERLVELGHERITYVHHGRTTPSASDRRAGIAQTTASSRVSVHLADATLVALVDIVESAIAEGVTALVAEDWPLAEELVTILAARGLEIPTDMSLISLSEVSGHSVNGLPLTGFDLRRERVASRALALLQDLILAEPHSADLPSRQILLAGELVEGATVARRKA